MHGIVSTEERISHNEEVSSVLSDGHSTKSTLCILSGNFNNVIRRVHFEPNIFLFAVKSSREHEFDRSEFRSLVAEESKGTVLNDVLFNLELMDNLFCEGLPVVGRDHSERSTSIKNSVN